MALITPANDLLVIMKDLLEHLRRTEKLSPQARYRIETELLRYDMLVEEGEVK